MTRAWWCCQHGAALDKVASAAQALHDTDAQIAAFSAQGQGDPARLDFLQFQIQELEALALQADELPRLESEHRRLANAGRLLEDGTQALNSLAGDDAAADASSPRWPSWTRPLPSWCRRWSLPAPSCRT